MTRYEASFLAALLDQYGYKAVLFCVAAFVDRAIDDEEDADRLKAHALMLAREIGEALAR